MRLGGRDTTQEPAAAGSRIRRITRLGVGGDERDAKRGRGRAVEERRESSAPTFLVVLGKFVVYFSLQLRERSM